MTMILEGNSKFQFYFFVPNQITNALHKDSVCYDYD